MGLTLPQALRMATAVPAACIGMGDRLGRLAPGAPADMVHLDAEMQLDGVWRGGVAI